MCSICVCVRVCVSLCVCSCMSTCASLFVCMCGCVYVGFILMIVQDKKASIRYELWLNGGSPSESVRYDKCLYVEIDGVLIIATIKASAGSNVFNRQVAACAPCGQVPTSRNADANPQGLRHLADDMFNTTTSHSLLQHNTLVQAPPRCNPRTEMSSSSMFFLLNGQW